MRLEAGGEPFFFTGNDVGCLLVHGFPGTPREMLWLGESLHRQGYSVLAVRLSGHATDARDLLHVRTQDWLANLEDGYHLLRGQCNKIILIGLSLGGILSANLTAHFELDGLVLMAMPMTLPRRANQWRPILPILKLIWHYRTPQETSDWHDKEAERLNLHYPVQPLNAIGEVVDLVNDLPPVLRKVSLPTLLIYSKDDDSVAAEDGIQALETIASSEKRLVWIEGSGHNLPCDAQREQVFSTIGQFVQMVAVK